VIGLGEDSENLLRHVIASEAWQSPIYRAALQVGDCHASLAMTVVWGS